MSQKNSARSLRQIMRNAPRAVLSTTSYNHPQVEDGWPTGSAVIPACDIDGSPLILISELADHTRHIAHDPRVSLLYATSSGSPGIPPEQDTARDADNTADTARMTVFGRAVKSGDTDLKGRYLASRPSAAIYAGFADFSIYRIEVTAAYWVGGFGKQRRLRGDQLVVPACQELVAAHDDIVAHMNDDHSDALARIAQFYGLENGDSASTWQMSTLDCDGMVLTCNDAVRRIDFPHTITDAVSARSILVEMSQNARKTVS